MPLKTAHSSDGIPGIILTISDNHDRTLLPNYLGSRLLLKSDDSSTKKSAFEIAGLPNQQWLMLKATQNI